MDFEDFFEPEVAVAAAITAALFSKRVRKVLRRGAVLGVAGAIVAGEAAQKVARGLGQSAQQLAASTATAAAAASQRMREQANAASPNGVPAAPGTAHIVGQESAERAGATAE
jgi:hypothetical protein